MAKVDHIVALLEGRISRGDYTLRPIPAENHLASETGVSRMTARKAILRLVDRGLLTRTDKGRLLVASPVPPSSKNKPVRGKARSVSRLSKSIGNIGFAAPAYGSPEIDRWRIATETAVARAGGRVRIVHFHHWDDPILSDAVSTFEGLFIVPPAEPVTDTLAARLRKGPARVVALDSDLTAHGIRSVNPTPPAAVIRLLDHLSTLGHHHIDCFNCQPLDAVVQQRIGQWSLWRAMHEAEGALLNHPDKSYGDPPRHAYETMKRRLAKAPLDATAILCITMPAALGAMRALYEKNIRIGIDVSVCAVNDEGLCAYLCPSLTATRIPDPVPYIARSLKWMAGADPVGPTLTQPAEVPLFIGESTGPAPKR